MVHLYICKRLSPRRVLFANNRILRESSDTSVIRQIYNFKKHIIAVKSERNSKVIIKNLIRLEKMRYLAGILLL